MKHDTPKDFTPSANTSPTRNPNHQRLREMKAGLKQAFLPTKRRKKTVRHPSNQSFAERITK